jgi:hypothetical protein
MVNQDLLWAVNDGGHGPVVFALGLDGRDRGQIRVSDSVNRDWEGLATFDWNDRAMILIGDFGDNKQQHDQHTLYVIEEPTLDGERFGQKTMVQPQWRIVFSYPDRNHDAEGVAVDPQTGTVLVLTKRDDPPILFSLPLKPAAGDSPVVAQRIATLDQIPPPTKEDLRYPYGHVRSQPTGMDLSEDGLSLVVLTYKHAFLYRRQPEASWADILGGPPLSIPLPLPENNRDLKQREAICFSRAETFLFVTSEGKQAGIYRLVSGGEGDGQ